MYLIPSLLLVLFLGRPVYLNSLNYTSYVDPLEKEAIIPGEPFELISELFGRSQPEVTFMSKNQSLITYGVNTHHSAKALITTVAKLRVTAFHPIFVICKVTAEDGQFNIPYNVSVSDDCECDYPEIIEFQVEIGKQQPRIVYYDKEYKEAVGYDAVLPCRVTGNEWADRVWTNNKNRVVETGDDNKYYISYVGDLTIKNLNAKDAGVYKCEVRNRHGTDEIQTDVHVLRN